MPHYQTFSIPTSVISSASPRHCEVVGRARAGVTRHWHRRSTKPPIIDLLFVEEHAQVLLAILSHNRRSFSYTAYGTTLTPIFVPSMNCALQYSRDVTGFGVRLSFYLTACALQVYIFTNCVSEAPLYMTASLHPYPSIRTDAQHTMLMSTG